MPASDWVNKTHVGDCRTLMKAMLADAIRVQCVVTSPPYWGLRDYGVTGQLGLERTWIRHVAAMRGVFRLVRALLVPEGLLWLNYGDSYYTPRVAGNDRGATSKINGQESQRAARDASRLMHSLKQKTNAGSSHRSAANRRYDAAAGLKPKDLVGMPWRIALALQEDGWWLRSDIVWHKPNPMPESMRDRPTKAHEYVFLMSRAEEYFYDYDAVREPVTGTAHPRGSGVNPKAADHPSGWAAGAGVSHVTKDHARQSQDLKTAAKFGHTAGWRARAKQNASFSAAVTGTGTPADSLLQVQIPVDGPASSSGNLERKDSSQRGCPDGMGKNQAGSVPWEGDDRNMRTVWTLPTQPFGGAHFATFPAELVARCIAAGSRPGDIVFDPFMGSGTVAQVAESMGRRFVGCELNPEYAAMYGTLRGAQQGMEI